MREAMVADGEDLRSVFQVLKLTAGDVLYVQMPDSVPPERALDIGRQLRESLKYLELPLVPIVVSQRSERVSLEAIPRDQAIAILKRIVEQDAPSDA